MCVCVWVVTLNCIIAEMFANWTANEEYANKSNQ